MQYKEFQSGKMQSDASMKTGHLIEKNLEHSDSGGDNEQQTHEKSALLHTMLLWAACTTFFEKLHVCFLFYHYTP